MEPLGRLLMVLGVALLAIGAILAFGPSLPFLGRLPGDIQVERPGFRLYFPVATSVVLSVVLSLLLWLFSRGR